MDDLSDYIKWLGEFPFSQVPFREADALVLCALSYIDFGPGFSIDGTRRRKCTVREFCEMTKKTGISVMTTGSDAGYRELLENAAASRRFGDLVMTDYADLTRSDPPLQFSAVCFHDLSKISFLAYRGTDNTIAGWREDFMISFTRTEAQEMALAYAQKKIGRRSARKWYVGGHSKGGNLALYASCLLPPELFAAVEHIYLLDGPGFCPEVLDTDAAARVDAKTTRILPGFSVVGKLFEPAVGDMKIVQSSQNGFRQHSIISWGIDHGKPACIAENDPTSIWIGDTVNTWIENISPEDREVFVGELFDALAAGGAETFAEIGTEGKEGRDAVLRKFLEVSDVTKQSVSSLYRCALRIGMQNLREKINADLSAISKR